MALLQPIWLLAGALIGIPVLIHWWRSRQGRVMRIGSIRFLPKVSASQASRRRITEWLLLATRCAMILLAALWMAEPVLQNIASHLEGKGWVLVPREGISRNRELIDSLLSGGYKLHAWEKDFPEIKLRDSAGIGQSRYDHFTLLDALDRSIPAGLPVVLITPDGVRGFSGAKPKVNRPVQWRLYHDQHPESSPLVPSLPEKILFFRDSGKFLQQELYLTAAFSSLKDYLKAGTQIVKLNQPPGRGSMDSSSLLVWLSTSPLPVIPKTVLVIAPDTFDDGTLAADDLPERLFWLLHPGNEKQALTRMTDKIDPSMLKDFPTGMKNHAAPAFQASVHLDTWMIGLLILLFATERWLRWRKTKS